MRREFSRNRLLIGVDISFITILILSVALVTLAQTTRAGRGSAQGPVVAAQESKSDTGPMSKQPRLFQKAVTYGPGGAQASSVAVADLNGDGKADIVVTNCGGCYGPPRIGHSGSVGVMLGNGDGTFEPAVTYDSGGAIPVFVAVADLNGDGKPDLAVVNRNSANIGVLLGNGDGTFQPAITYGSADGFFSPVLVAVADLNGDGRPDLVVANRCSDENCDGAAGVLLNNGDGTFRPAAMYLSGGAYANSVAVADVNRDGKPDVIVANDQSSPGARDGNVGVLLGNGDGTLQAAETYPASGNIPLESSVLAIADVNGDGKPDLVVTGSGVGVLIGNGDGTFQPVVTYETDGRSRGTSVAVADVDLDGKLDIIATGQCHGGNCINQGLAAVLRGNGDGTFQAAEIHLSGGYLTNSVAVADVNGDRKPDLIVANICADDTLYCQISSVGVLLSTGAIETKIAVTSSGSPSQAGQAVTFAAMVTPRYGAVPDGELVTFYDGNSLLGSEALAGGVAAYTTSSLLPKTHGITATYAGDARFKPRTGRVTQVVERYTTTTSLSSSLNPSQFGQRVTFTVRVTSSGPSPTGRVTFLDGTNNLGSASLRGSEATLTTAKLAVGMHPITAKYLGDADDAKSTSPVLEQVVQ
jgi:Bacterial Ig-like domain (group 3)/FG-GAP-like repeat